MRVVNYPRAKRNVEDRGQSKTEEDRRIAREFAPPPCLDTRCRSTALTHAPCTRTKYHC